VLIILVSTLPEQFCCCGSLYVGPDAALSSFKWLILRTRAPSRQIKCNYPWKCEFLCLLNGQYGHSRNQLATKRGRGIPGGQEPAVGWCAAGRPPPARERREPRGWAAILKCSYFRSVWWVGQDEPIRMKISRKTGRLAQSCAMLVYIKSGEPVFGNRRETGDRASQR
jgi:hypothetical protein